MPSYTGLEIVTRALGLAGVLDPLETPDPSTQQRGLQAINDLLDAWRTNRLTIGAVTRSVYSLTAGTASYTLGPSGTMPQSYYPSALLRWAVIPDDDADPVVEIPRGRLLTADEWAQLRVKAQTGAYPTSLYFDYTHTGDGLGTLYVHPIPEGNDVDIVLYQKVPDLPSIALGTTYALRPGVARALRWNGALEVAIEFGVAENITAMMDLKARESLADLKRTSIRPNQARTRPEFIVRSSRRRFNIRQDV